MKDIEKVLSQLEALARKWQGDGSGTGDADGILSASP
jgi:hypothetical protein